MEKTYKYNHIYIGTSDRAELTLRFFNVEKKTIDHQGLHFGSDGAYSAYLIQDEEAVEIPERYQLVFEKQVPWLEIIDDMAVISFDSLESIKIYRAGAFGCIICLKHLK